MADVRAVEQKLADLQAAVDAEQEQVRRALAGTVQGTGSVVLPAPRLAFGDRLVLPRPRLNGRGTVS